MLIGNYSVLSKHPGRNIGGGAIGLGNNRSDFNKTSMARGVFVGEAAHEPKSGVPDGYRPPYCWVLPIKAGAIAARNNLVGEGAVSFSNLAGGLNAVAPLTGVGALTSDIIAKGIIASGLTGAGDVTTTINGLGELTSAVTGSGTISSAAMGLVTSVLASLSGSGTVSSAAMGLLVSAVAALSGSGTATADIRATIAAAAALSGSGTVTNADMSGQFVMAASLAGEGDLTGSLLALAHIAAALSGTGTPSSAVLNATGTMAADIIVTGDLLNTANVADAILDALNGVEQGLTVREAIRLIAAATAGKVSGAGGATVTIRNAVADSKDRIVATVDSNGNRSSVTTDVT